MLTKDGFGVTKKFIDYAAPLVGPMPAYSTLKNKLVKPPRRRK
jgi:hypothetical protein